MRIKMPMIVACVSMVVASVLGGAQAVTPTIPRTPAGEELRAWLEAYNSGDSLQADAYFRARQPDQSARGIFLFRGMTGGLNLLSVERNEPGHLEFIAQFRNGTMMGYGSLEVNSNAPYRIAKLEIEPLGEATSLASLGVNAATRSAVIAGVARLMDSLYVFPDVAKRIGDSLRAMFARGDYDRYGNGAGFARRLDSDVAAIAHDKHLRIRFSLPVIPARAAETAPPVPPSAIELAAFRRQMGERNCGFRKAEQLDGNVGYLKLDSFRGAEVCEPTVAGAMAFVASSRALILDLRENGGGSPDMVALVASYLFDRRTHLGDLWTRHTGQTLEIWTRDSVAGQRFDGDKPIYILTSSRTFSGGEEFAYDLQAVKRAIVVGETTGGGAHPVHEERIDDHFMIDVPYARSINPITHTNWEGAGVQPDVKVPAADALAAAQRLLQQIDHRPIAPQLGAVDGRPVVGRPRQSHHLTRSPHR
jgi:Peptidase family S41/N-terminal domain of Peptidase_S41 in eukaryotic IRBP